MTDPRAVSYTHLDVYKRQHTHTRNLLEKYVTVQMVRQSLGGGEGSLIFSLLWVSWVGAVSYTHLDVYKRQDQYCTPLYKNYSD